MLQAKLKTVQKIRTSIRHASVNYDAHHDPELTPSDKDLLSALSVMAGAKGYCYPRLTYICIYLDLNPFTNRRNIKRRLAKLEQLGYLTRVERFEHEDGTGRQRSNYIVLNYDCSLTKVENRHLRALNPWDRVEENDVSDTTQNPSFTPPRNIYIEKEKIYKKEKEENYPHEGANENIPPSLSLSGAIAQGNVSFGVDGEKKFSRKVYNWYKRPVRFYPTQRSGFTHVRSKYGVLAHMQKEDLHTHTQELPLEVKITSNDNQTVRPAPDDKIFPEKYGPVPTDHPYFRFVYHALYGVEYGSQNLSPDSVNNPVDKPRKPLQHMGANGAEENMWEQICGEVKKIKPEFEHWELGLGFKLIYNGKISLTAKNEFMKNTIEVRFRSDILKACKNLKLEANWLEIEVKK